MILFDRLLAAFVMESRLSYSSALWKSSKNAVSARLLSQSPLIDWQKSSTYLTPFLRNLFSVVTVWSMFPTMLSPSMASLISQLIFYVFSFFPCVLLYLFLAFSPWVFWGGSVIRSIVLLFVFIVVCFVLSCLVFSLKSIFLIAEYSFSFSFGRKNMRI